MKYRVVVLREAEQDIERIYDYVAVHGSVASADKIALSVGKAFESLANFPERGNKPPELARLDLGEFRELHVEPYRIFYSLRAKTVFVYAVFDARRNVRELIRHRLSPKRTT